MSTPTRVLRLALLATTALVTCVAAAAQPGNAPDTRPFLDIAIGKPIYGTSCGNIAGLSCSNNGTSVSVTAGDMWSRNWGAELSYLNLGKADRAGGTVDARGVNISIVGRLPLGDSFDLEGKVGTTYGITHVNANPTSGVATGRDSGFGLGYGLALGVHFVRGLSGEVGWEQHDFHFVGQGTQTVQNITVGLDYSF